MGEEELIGLCLGEVDGGRKGVFCPNLYSPLCTSSSMNSKILMDILKMTLVDKYTSYYFNDDLIYKEYASFQPHIPGVCQQIPNQQNYGICLVYAKVLPV